MLSSIKFNYLNSSISADEIIRLIDIGTVNRARIIYNSALSKTIEFEKFHVRYKRLLIRNVFNAETLCDALYLSSERYLRKHRVRKTTVLLNEDTVCLNREFSKIKKKTVNLSSFRSRLKTFSLRQLKYQIDNEENIIKWAATLSTKEWSKVVGFGHAKFFIYQGTKYETQNMRRFSTIYHFMFLNNLTEIYHLVRSRLKQSWHIDKAIETEKYRPTSTSGTIYHLRCTKTNLVYIGITSRGIYNRLREHIQSAKKGSNQIIHKAIREFGIKNFKISVLESNLNNEELRQKEVLYIQELNTRAPDGYNNSKGGEFASRQGIKVRTELGIFSSIKQASIELSNLTNGSIPAYVIENRIRKGDLNLLSSSRRHSKHLDAGTNLFRRHLQLKRRKRLDNSWFDYDRFKADVLENTSMKDILMKKLRLKTINSKKLFSKKNFNWKA